MDSSMAELVCMRGPLSDRVASGSSQNKFPTLTRCRVGNRCCSSKRRLGEGIAASRASEPLVAGPRATPALQAFGGNRHADALGDRIEDRRVTRTQLPELAHLLLRCVVGLDAQLHANILESVAHIGVEIQEPAKIEIALQR